MCTTKKILILFYSNRWGSKKEKLGEKTLTVKKEDKYIEVKEDVMEQVSDIFYFKYSYFYIINFQANVNHLTQLYLNIKVIK